MTMATSTAVLMERILWTTKWIFS